MQVVRFWIYLQTALAILILNVRGRNMMTRVSGLSTWGGAVYFEVTMYICIYVDMDYTHTHIYIYIT